MSDRDHRIAFLASDGKPDDARLIAAAPTLLAILKAAAEDDVVQWHDGSLLKAARAAIARATGQ